VGGGTISLALGEDGASAPLAVQERAEGAP